MWSSYVCEPGHTHSADYRVAGHCRRWGGGSVRPSQQVLWLPGWHGGFPESTQSQPPSAKKMFPLLHQNLQRWWHLDGSFGAGATGGPQTSLVVHYDLSLSVAAWDLGPVGLALQDVTSVEESLVPTFAYLYSSAVTSPPLVCLCSINLQNRARSTCD